MRWHLFPWPARSERKQRIEEARVNAAASRREAVKADRIARDMRRIAYDENHWADRISGQFMQHHQGG